MKYLSLLVFMLLSKVLNAQSTNAAFHKIDSISFALGELKDMEISSATNAITKPFKDPTYKVRAIYAWIANNIRYDCEAYHVEAKRKSSAEDVYKLRRGVCAGYANLFQEMCSYANIQCVTIDGDARNGIAPCEKRGSEINHSWNAVRIDNQWHLIDPTWASGGTDEKVKTFTKDFSEAYFFPNPESFMLSHYPQVKYWTLSRKPIGKNDFLEIPTARTGILNLNVTAFSPTNGTIKKKQGSIVKFFFQCKNAAEVYRITISTGSSHNTHVSDIPFEVDKNAISFTSEKLTEGEYPLIIFINGIEALIYCMHIE
jgi:transglutaminase/protease-like cytokinesis protein 3